MKKTRSTWVIKGANFHQVMVMASAVLSRTRYTGLAKEMQKYTWQLFHQIPVDVAINRPKDSPVCQGKTTDRIRDIYIGFFFSVGRISPDVRKQTGIDKMQIIGIGKDWLRNTGLFSSKMEYIGTVKEVNLLFAKMKRDGIIGPIPSDETAANWIAAFGLETTAAAIKQARYKSRHPKNN
jgi:hypothetical protein